MASHEELRLALRQALKARSFDLKLCLARAKALKVAGLDPIAAMDFDRWSRQLRQLETEASPSQRARLLASLDRISWSGGGIAIRKRSVRFEAASPAR